MTSTPDQARSGWQRPAAIFAAGLLIGASAAGLGAWHTESRLTEPTSEASTDFAGLPPRWLRGDKAVGVFLASPPEITKLCGAKAGACEWRDAWRRPLMVLPNPCDADGIEDANDSPLSGAEAFAVMVCHELGHANGWPGDHPKGVAPSAETRPRGTGYLAIVGGHVEWRLFKRPQDCISSLDGVRKAARADGVRGERSGCYAITPQGEALK